jgi:proteasome lid subunit RPN8/RPN11
MPAFLDYQSRDQTRVRVVIPRTACDEMIDHARVSARHEVEVGGFLVGTAEEPSPKNFLVTVTDVLRARPRDSSMSHVEFGPDAWNSLHKEFDDRFEAEGKVRLGWYHTHPNQGIFFSGPDLNSHLDWKRPYQFGLVIDPRNLDCGLFHWAAEPTAPDAPAHVLQEYLAERLLFSLQAAPPAGAAGRRSPPESGPRPEPRDDPGRAGRAAGWARDLDEPEGFASPWFWLAVLASFVVGGVVLLATWPDADGGPHRQPKPFDPAPLALTAAVALFALVRLWNARVFRPGSSGGDPWARGAGPEPPFLWWRLLAVLGAQGGLLWCGWPLRTPAAPVLAVALTTLMLFVLLELAVAGLFAGPPGPELAVLRPLAGWASETGTGLADAGRAAWAAGRSLLPWALAAATFAWLACGAAWLWYTEGAHGFTFSYARQDPANWFVLLAAPVLLVPLVVYCLADSALERRRLSRERAAAATPGPRLLVQPSPPPPRTQEGPSYGPSPLPRRTQE